MAIKLVTNWEQRPGVSNDEACQEHCRMRCEENLWLPANVLSQTQCTLHNASASLHRLLDLQSHALLFVNKSFPPAIKLLHNQVIPIFAKESTTVVKERVKESF